MENLDSAYISIENKSAYFCSLDIEWLTTFDTRIIEKINDLTILTEDDKLVDCDNFRNDLLGKTYNYFNQIIELNYSQDLVYFDFKFDNGIELNFHLGEVSLIFESKDSLEQTCRDILRKAKFKVDNTFQKLIEFKHYCSIEAPDYVSVSK